MIRFLNNFSRAIVCTAVLGSLFLTSAAIGSNRPGVGTTPAFICLKTTITEAGHTRMTSIMRKSGNPMADRNALKFVRMLKYTLEDGVEREARNVHLLVKFYQNGQFAFNTFEHSDPLPEVCTSPPGLYPPEV
jgi:hypothetical protein